jgi:glycosyltransferase involved in cell wall biosynthesis
MQANTRLSPVAVITSFPNPADKAGRKQGFNAVGWHSERLLTALAAKRDVVVFAEKIGKTKSFSPVPGLVVERSWEKGSIVSLLALYNTIANRKDITHVFVQFEFNVFGGIIPNLAVLFVLLMLRLTGKHITFEVHQVITDIKKLEKHIAITNPLIQAFFNVSLRMFYRMLGLIVHDIIVFEQALKNALSAFVKADKISVLSLPVQQGEKRNKQLARKHIGLKKDEFVVLVFGFINGYKGIDWIINHLANNKTNVRLLLVGGPNPYLQDKPFYQKFYQGIMQQVKQNSSFITHVGFVKDQDIATYFAASDIAVLPYEVFMSASGPFSHALSYQTPILLSQKLLDYSKSEDFATNMKEAALTKNELFFPLNNNALSTLLSRAQKSAAYRNKLHQFSTSLGTTRSLENVANHVNAMFTPSPEAIKHAGVFAKIS